MMLRSFVKPLERCLGRRGDGLMWNMELKQHATGDFSMAVVQANSYLEDQTQVYTSPSSTYVGVYDGHGGHQASQFLNSHLFSSLHKFVSENRGISADVIRKAFSSTEDEFMGLVKQTFPKQPQIATVGSCCLVGAIVEDELFVANLGDSRAVLGRRASTKHKNIVAERLSTDHNVAEEEIRREVEALHPDDSQVVVYNRGVWRIKGIIQRTMRGVLWLCPSTNVLFLSLSPSSLIESSYVIGDFGDTIVDVSRSIGDVYLKEPDFGRFIPLRRPVITAEPSVIRRQLKPQDLFLIFASDGLWEQLSDQAAVEIVFKNPRAGIAKRLVTAALQEAAKKRELSYGDIKKIEKGIRRHFHDDISVVVVYLDHNAKFKQSASGYTAAPKDISTLDTKKV